LLLTYELLIQIWWNGPWMAPFQNCVRWSRLPTKWMEGGAVEHNFERDPPRDHPCQVWFNLVQRFQRRFKCEKLRRTTTDAKWWFLNQIKPNLAGMVLGWVPFKIVSDSPALHSGWLLLLKIEISSIVHCCFSIVKMSLNFNCSYMVRSHNFERDPPKDHLCQVWFNLVQRFQRRRFKCESLRR
jgi:hypothetical protein